MRTHVTPTQTHKVGKAWKRAKRQGWQSVEKSKETRTTDSRALTYESSIPQLHVPLRQVSVWSIISWTILLKQSSSEVKVAASCTPLLLVYKHFYKHTHARSPARTNAHIHEHTPAYVKTQFGLLVSWSQCLKGTENVLLTLKHIATNEFCHIGFWHKLMKIMKIVFSVNCHANSRPSK